MKKLFSRKTRKPQHQIDVVVVEKGQVNDIPDGNIDLNLEVIDDRIVGMVNGYIIDMEYYNNGEDIIKYFPLYMKAKKYSQEIIKLAEANEEKLAKAGFNKYSYTKPTTQFKNYSIKKAVLIDIDSQYLYQEFMNLDELKNKYKYIRKIYGIVKKLTDK